MMMMIDSLLLFDCFACSAFLFFAKGTFQVEPEEIDSFEEESKLFISEEGYIVVPEYETDPKKLN